MPHTRDKSLRARLAAIASRQFRTHSAGPGSGGNDGRARHASNPGVEAAHLQKGGKSKLAAVAWVGRLGLTPGLGQIDVSVIVWILQVFVRTSNNEHAVGLPLRDGNHSNGR